MNTHLVMIVDDDDADFDQFRESLQRLDPGITCLKARHGMDALRQLFENELYPDLILIDLDMPRMDGKGCLAEIKKSSRLCHIPVILYSTSKHAADIGEIGNLGAAYFLRKPDKAADLQKALGIILANNLKDAPVSNAFLTSFVNGN